MAKETEEVTARIQIAMELAANVARMEVEKAHEWAKQAAIVNAAVIVAGTKQFMV